MSKFAVRLTAQMNSTVLMESAMEGYLLDAGFVAVWLGFNVRFER